MELTKNAPGKLYLYECRNKHRVTRETERNAANCSRCGANFSLIAITHRKDNETDIQHRIRTLDHKRPRAN